jgi:hypothetical protein
MHERALETREPSCVHRTAKSFFIPAVHSPPGAIGHVVAAELLSQKGRALSRGTRGSTRAPLSEKAEPRAMGYVATRSSPQQGGEVRSRGRRESSGAHLVNEARSIAEGHMAAPELTSARR